MPSNIGRIEGLASIARRRLPRARRAGMIEAGARYRSEFAGGHANAGLPKGHRQARRMRKIAGERPKNSSFSRWQ